MEKQLIVTADDFGLTPGINHGILDAWRRGIVTRTSLMACGRAFDHAVALLNETEQPPVGVHLTLVGERPVAAPRHIRSLLTASDTFLADYRQFIARYCMGRIRPDHVRIEFEAQLRRVHDAGIVIHHLDSHQHLHLLPSILEVTIELAHAHGATRLRVPERSLRPSVNVKTFGLRLAAVAGAGRLRRAGLICPDRLCGIRHAGHLEEPYLHDLLAALQPGCTELVCHPGQQDADYQRHYAHWGYSPQCELEALTSPAVAQAVRIHGIHLIP